MAAVAVKVPGNFGTVVREGREAHKFSLGDTDFSWERRTVPTILCYSLVHYLTKFITFQDAVQRYLSVPSNKVGKQKSCEHMCIKGEYVAEKLECSFVLHSHDETSCCSGVMGECFVVAASPILLTSVFAVSSKASFHHQRAR